MNKYIDAEKLISEIKALKHRKGFLSFENTEITEAYMARGVQFTCDDILNIIQSLQQEQQEVDLEDIENNAELIANKIMIGVQSNRYHTCVYNTERNDFNHSHLVQAARKGIELRLNTKK